MLFTFSALKSNIYWCGLVSHQQILMVRHVAPAENIGAVNAAPAAPVSTPMSRIRLHVIVTSFKRKNDVIPSNAMNDVIFQ